MFIANVSGHYWRVWSHNVRAGTVPPSKSEMRKEATEECMQQNKVSAANAHRERKERTNRKAVEGYMLGPQSKPATVYVPGNDALRRDTQAWTEKMRQKLKKEKEESTKQRRRTNENYGQLESGMPGPHIYSNIQFCSKELLGAGFKEIKVLGDATYGIPLKDCRDFDHYVEDGDLFLCTKADECCTKIKDSWPFMEAAISIMPTEQQTQWHQAYQLNATPSELLQAKKENWKTLLCLHFEQPVFMIRTKVQRSKYLCTRATETR